MKEVRKEKRKQIKVKILEEKEKLQAELAASDAPAAMVVQ
tara:strand:+ start:1046 stop:1165 length:120 start_codon:yes stop_codon:yes gene_type:complete